MYSDDVLGEDGRTALNACVRVKVLRNLNPLELPQYSREDALTRVQNCYGGRLPQGLDTWRLYDPLVLYDQRNNHQLDISKLKRTYNIADIVGALSDFDEKFYVEKDPEDEPDAEQMKAKIKERRAAVSSELKEDPNNRRKYSWIVAQRRVRDCFAGKFAGDADILGHRVGLKPYYTMSDIHEAYVDIDRKKQLIKYPQDEGPGSKEWKDLIDENIESMRSEYYKHPQQKYSRGVAERRLRNCFAGTLPVDTVILSPREGADNFPYDISDIHNAIAKFDDKKLIDKHPKQNGHRDLERKNEVDKQRADIRNEFEEATKPEIEHGTGFIVAGVNNDDHHIVTNKHVVDTFLENSGKGNCEIRICNEVICNEVIDDLDVDEPNDLVLLHCSKLNSFENSKIHPLELFPESLKTGQPVFCFGYPIHHHGNTALFVNGSVSGHQERISGGPLVMLHCSLSSGCSGGPVMRRVKNQLQVLGVVKEKHIKDILTQKEQNLIEKLSRDRGTVSGDAEVAKVVLKLNEALTGTHSPFNFVNVIPAEKVVKFLHSLEKENNNENQAILTKSNFDQNQAL